MADKKLAIIFTGEVGSARKSIADLNTALGTTEKQGEQTGAKLKEALGGVALAAAMKFSVDAAGDLAEAQAKNNQVFGDSIGVINEFASGATDALGLSRREALQATGTFGNMFTQLGAGKAQAADMSKSMIQLGADFAAYHDANPVDVIEAQTAAFRGEYDALQKFVPTINAATVEQRAMADSGKANASSLTDMEKAQATYNIMLESAGAATGAAAREADGLAMSNKRARAEIENAAASFGGVMLPAAADLAGVVGDLAGVVGELPQPVQTSALAAIAAAMAWSRWGDSVSGATGSVLSKWRTLSEGLDGVAATRGITKTQAATEALKSSMSGAIGPSGRLEKAIGGISVGAGAAGLAVVGLGAILYAWQDEQAKAAKRAAELAAAVASIADEAVRTGAAVEDVFTSQALPTSVGVTSGLFQQLGIDLGELNAMLLAGGEEWNAYARAQVAAAGGMDSDKGMALAVVFRDLQGQLDGARVSTDAQREAFSQLGIVIDPVTGDMTVLGQAVDDTTEAQKSAEEQARRTASAFSSMGDIGGDAFRHLGEGIDFAEMAAAAYTSRALDVFDAQQAYSDSTQALTAHLSEAAEVEARNAENTRRNADALRQHAEEIDRAAAQVADAVETQKEAQDALTEAYAAARPEAEAMVAAERQVAEARESQVAAADRSRLAQEGLNQALIDGAQYLRDLAEASDDSNRSVDRAQLNYERALAAQAELAQKGSDDPFAERAAALAVADALDALEDARRRSTEAAQTQAEAERAGVEGTPMVVAARREITDAASAEEAAAERLAAAQKSQAETQAAAAEAITEAQGRLAEATAAVNTAQANLSATQAAGVELTKNEAVQQEDLGSKIKANALNKLELAQKIAMASGEMLTEAESAAILRQGLDEGRAATGFWSTDLETLGQKLDYAAMSRVVELDTVGALERARELGYKVETLPNGHIRVTADTSQADGALDALGMKIGALGSQLTGQLGVVLATAVQGRASGGPVTKGQTYMVGEAGPELVTMGGDGWVTDAARTRQLLAASGPRGSTSAALAMATAHGVASTPVVVHLTVQGSLVHERDLPGFLADALNKGARAQARPLLDAGVTSLARR